MISHTVILSVPTGNHTVILSVKPIYLTYWKVSVSMISHTVILSVLINLLESISQYDISHSDIVSINKPTGKYQSV